jgi:hypothetical protein
VGQIKEKSRIERNPGLPAKYCDEELEYFHDILRQNQMTEKASGIVTLRYVIVAALFALLLCPVRARSADSLPSRLDNGSFWKLIADLSEPSGEFQSENLLSNETDFPEVMATLKSTVPSAGVYLGVGPEQNFNYVAAIRPRMVVIIDIRRQNMLEHFLYKALFELSPDRSAFISRLFSRRSAPEYGLTSASPAAELFDSIQDAAPDQAAFDQNLGDIRKLLVETHHFALTRDDLSIIENLYAAFRDFGPAINYNSRGSGIGGRAFMPSYQELMTETDRNGREWSYLASEENYKTVRDLELRNLIVPITGDFGGPSAIRSVGKFLKEHGAVVSAFYTSNVEGYLFRGGDRQGNPNGGPEKFYGNVAELPLNPSSTFIRWIPNGGGRSYGSSIALMPILSTIDDFKVGRFTSANLFPPRGYGFVRGFQGYINAMPPVSRSERMFGALSRVLPIILAAALIAALLAGLYFWKKGV